MIKGCDVSYCQQGLDYRLLKNAGVKFVLIRAGHGLKVDSLYELNTSMCIQNDIPFGYYWFCESSSINGVKAEANKLIELVGKYKLQYPVFFDLEELSLIKGLTKSQVSDLAIAFCETLIAEGIYAGIYTNPDWLNNHYDRSVLLGKYDIWLAHWTYNENKPSPYHFGQTIHQWGVEKIGKIDVDMDNCYIDYPSKIAKWRNERGIAMEGNTAYNKGSKVTVGAVPLYGSSIATAPLKVIIAEGDEFIIETGLVENGRIKVSNSNRFKGNWWVPVECVAALPQKGASSTLTDAQITAIAKDVIAGKYGSGTARKKSLINAGYPYEKIQERVNDLLLGKIK